MTPMMEHNSFQRHQRWDIIFPNDTNIPIIVLTDNGHSCGLALKPFCVWDSGLLP
ncbi:unnamed protein product, partial [Staurois parvus]